jgi:hypothetical protein
MGDFLCTEGSKVAEELENLLMSDWFGSTEVWSQRSLLRRQLQFMVVIYSRLFRPCIPILSNMECNMIQIIGDSNFEQTCYFGHGYAILLTYEQVLTISKLVAWSSNNVFIHQKLFQGWKEIDN